MRLSKLLEGMEIVASQGPLEVEITGIATHSGKVEPGNLFIASPGVKTNGRLFIEEAIRRGAKAVVLEGEIFDNLRATQIQVSGARLACAQLSANYFVHPTKALTLVGITGTNGKTTLTYLLEALWQGANKTTGVIGTINTRFGKSVVSANQTTPDSRDLQEILAQMRDSSIGCVAMEVSSHGLTQSRVEGCHFDGAVFTNLTQDHLDYHKDMEAYYRAKEKLFIHHLHQSSKPKKIALVNGDDLFGDRLVASIKALGLNVWSYGLKGNPSILASRVQLSMDGISATLQTPAGTFDVHSPLLGRFNLYNIMAACGVALNTGVSQAQVRKSLAGFQAVPGRLEKVGSHPSVFVDYAHTPDALSNVLKTLREVCKARLITVFGCGGDRDKTKRPLMGLEAGRFSDICFVTSDNPRTEDPEKIIQDILPGANQGSSKVVVEVDRRKAIEKALSEAGQKDMVLIAGKGHEDYQIIGDKKFPFSDQAVAKEWMKDNGI